MNVFKYVTPYWRDSHELFGEGFSAYTGTAFFVLNHNNENASVRIHFYDLEGKMYGDMEVSMLVPAGAVLDFRIVDIISFKNPDYRFSNNLRTGSISVLSDLPVAVSGRMYRGASGSNGVKDELVWSIPFIQAEAAKADVRTIHKPEIPVVDWSEYFKKRRKPL